MRVSDKGITVTNDPTTRSQTTAPSNTNKASDFIAKAQAKISHLSPEETREILTPFAFKIDQSLFGIALAVPWRRGAALLIDLLFVAILSGAPGELLAVLVAMTLFNLGSKKRAAKFGKKPGLRKAALRFIGAFIVFVVLVDMLPKIFSDMNEFNTNVEQAGQQQTPLAKNNQHNNSDEHSFIKGTLTLAATLAISQSDCQNYQCWQKLSSDLFSAYAQQAPSVSETEQYIEFLIDNISDRKILHNQQISQLTARLTELASSIALTSVQKTDVVLDEAEIDKGSSESNAAKAKELSALQRQQAIESASDSANDASSAAVYKGFAWLKGLVEDLGIGFGWAAFYFTMFTAIWHGQTPGKKLFRIRVIQLDGTPLSIWDSFGRYGGYGAGIATGLLGFAQIYWDPNRQAIHDKISATIVINDSDTGQERTAVQSDE